MEMTNQVSVCLTTTCEATHESVYWLLETSVTKCFGVLLCDTMSEYMEGVLYALFDSVQF